MWVAPKKVLASKRKKTDHYEDFMEDMVEECLTYANMGDHMLGNTFVRYEDEDQAEACIKGINGRFYARRMPNICKYG